MNWCSLNLVGKEALEFGGQLHSPLRTAWVAYSSKFVSSGFDHVKLQIVVDNPMLMYLQHSPAFAFAPMHSNFVLGGAGRSHGPAIAHE